MDQLGSFGDDDAAYVGDCDSAVAAFAQFTTARLPPSVTESKLQVALNNLRSLGRVYVERTLHAVSQDPYSWTISFLNDVGDQPYFYINAMNFIGLECPRLDS